MAAHDGLSDWGRYGEVARRLRDAHRRVAALPDERRPEATHRLIKITEMAKRDLNRAEERLTAFWDELNATNDYKTDKTPADRGCDGENDAPTR